MARPRQQPAEKPDEPTETERDLAEHAPEHVPEQAGEVRPEEFTTETAAPVWRSPFPEAVVEALRQPLDPGRVRTRQGRGRGQFEYLAGHDVKRRANELFGFGNWGTRVVEIVSLGEVAIAETKDGNETGRKGWHVGYHAVVEVRVRTESGDWVSYQDSGYGDGNEWGPAAQITARELAVKEAVTDAMKRAFTCLGDQFGLILYAKADEKQRIQRDTNLEGSRAAVPVEAAGPKRPASWAEAMRRFDKLVGVNVDAEDYDHRREEAAAWLEELCEQRFGLPSINDLSSEARLQALVGFSSTLMALEETPGELALAPNLREVIRLAFAAKNEGVVLEGPSWRLSPTETDRPTKAEHLSGAPADDVEQPAMTAEERAEAERSQRALAEAETETELPVAEETT